MSPYNEELNEKEVLDAINTVLTQFKNHNHKKEKKLSSINSLFNIELLERGSEYFNETLNILSEIFNPKPKNKKISEKDITRNDLNNDFANHYKLVFFILKKFNEHYLNVVTSIRNDNNSDKSYTSKLSLNASMLYELNFSVCKLVLKDILNSQSKNTIENKEMEIFYEMLKFLEFLSKDLFEKLKTFESKTFILSIDNDVNNSSIKDSLIKSRELYFYEAVIFFFSNLFGLENSTFIKGEIDGDDRENKIVFRNDEQFNIIENSNKYKSCHENKSKEMISGENITKRRSSNLIVNRILFSLILFLFKYNERILLYKMKNGSQLSSLFNNSSFLNKNASKSTIDNYIKNLTNILSFAELNEKKDENNAKINHNKIFLSKILKRVILNGNYIQNIFPFSVNYNESNESLSKNDNSNSINNEDYIEIKLNSNDSTVKPHKKNDCKTNLKKKNIIYDIIEDNSSNCEQNKEENKDLSEFLSFTLKTIELFKKEKDLEIKSNNHQSDNIELKLNEDNLENPNEKEKENENDYSINNFLHNILISNKKDYIKKNIEVIDIRKSNPKTLRVKKIREDEGVRKSLNIVIKEARYTNKILRKLELLFFKLQQHDYSFSSKFKNLFLNDSNTKLDEHGILIKALEDDLLLLGLNLNYTETEVIKFLENKTLFKRLIELLPDYNFLNQSEKRGMDKVTSISYLFNYLIKFIISSLNKSDDIIETSSVYKQNSNSESILGSNHISLKNNFEKKISFINSLIFSINETFHNNEYKSNLPDNKIEEEGISLISLQIQRRIKIKINLCSVYLSIKSLLQSLDNCIAKAHNILNFCNNNDHNDPGHTEIKENFNYQINKNTSIITEETKKVIQETQCYLIFNLYSVYQVLNILINRLTCGFDFSLIIKLINDLISDFFNWMINKNSFNVDYCFEIMFSNSIFHSKKELWFFQNYNLMKTDHSVDYTEEFSSELPYYYSKCFFSIANLKRSFDEIDLFLHFLFQKIESSHTLLNKIEYFLELDFIEGLNLYLFWLEKFPLNSEFNKIKELLEKRVDYEVLFDCVKKGTVSFISEYVIMNLKKIKMKNQEHKIKEKEKIEMASKINEDKCKYDSLYKDFPNSFPSNQKKIKNNSSKDNYIDHDLMAISENYIKIKFSRLISCLKRLYGLSVECFNMKNQDPQHFQELIKQKEVNSSLETINNPINNNNKLNISNNPSETNVFLSMLMNNINKNKENKEEKENDFVINFAKKNLFELIEKIIDFHRKMYGYCNSNLNLRKFLLQELSKLISL